MFAPGPGGSGCGALRLAAAVGLFLKLVASGGGYAGISASVGVKVTDNDKYEPPIVDPESQRLDEGASEQLEVRLPTEPTGNVTVSVTSNHTGAAAVEPASLTFKTSNYASVQMVRVTAVQDDDAADQDVTVTVAASGGGYTGQSTEASVTVRDDDEPALVVSRSSLALDENGSDIFTIKLATQPTKPVTVVVSVPSKDAGKVSVSLASLTFTGSDWGRARTVKVTGRDDPDATDESATVNLTASGGDYEGEAAEVDVTIEDDDEPEVVVSPAPPDVLEVEEGGNRPFSVELATQPASPVTVTVSVPSHASGEVSVSPTRLTFRTSNYATPQTVWVSGEQDDDATDEQGSINLTAIGADYGGRSASVHVAVKDDDEADLVVSAESLEIPEGSSRTYTVKLATEPTAAVTVTISGMAKGVTVDDSSLAFSTLNWSTPQMVTVSAAEDDNAASEEVALTNTPSGGGYASVAAKTVKVATEDNDTPGLVLSTSSLSVGEGSSGTYTVKLATEPTGPVTVTISGMAKGVSVEEASLTFSTSNWSNAQTVTVSAAEDDNSAPEEVTLTNTPSGGGYASVAAKAVLVTATDNDTPALLVTPGSLELVEGAEGKGFTVKLATAPREAVAVSVSVPDGDVGKVTVKPASLTFTADDYGSVQTVTVTGAQDDDAQDETAAVDLKASGGDYDGVSASVAVTVTDVASTSDDASFVSYTGVPSTMAAGSAATVTVRMRNTGTTTWTSAAGYQLGSQRPNDNVTWGLGRVSLPSDVAPRATVDFTFQITAPMAR